jgi:transcriptional regulator with XRE-family HTH domain
MPSPAQCRAARGLLDWSRSDLAQRAGVGAVTVRQLETGSHVPRRATREVVRRALETAGVEFIDENGGGAGVRLRHSASGNEAIGSHGHPRGGPTPSRPNQSD